MSAGGGAQKRLPCPFPAFWRIFLVPVAVDRGAKKTAFYGSFGSFGLVFLFLGSRAAPAASGGGSGEVVARAERTNS